MTFNYTLENMKTCLICHKEFVRLASHIVRSHDIDYEEYLLKFEHNGVRPKCACGCGQEVKFTRSYGMGFTKYVHGHSARVPGRLTEESKRKIGEKNRENMRRWTKKNPKAAMRKIEKMNTAITPEVRKRQAKACAETWKKPYMSHKRKAAGDRAIELLAQNKIGPQAPYKTEYKLNPFTGKKEWMHSSWESAFLDACVEQNLSVTKAHSIRIDYTDTQGNQRQYVPDFLGEGVLFEVKGHESEEDLLKYRAAEKWCEERDMEFVVLGRDVFFGMSFRSGTYLGMHAGERHESYKSTTEKDHQGIYQSD